MAMDKRTNESPMDFEWQTGRGPVDKNSSFMRPVHASQGPIAMLGQKRKWCRLYSGLWISILIEYIARHIQQLRLSPEASDAVARACDAFDIFPLLPSPSPYLVHFHFILPK